MLEGSSSSSNSVLDHCLLIIKMLHFIFNICCEPIAILKILLNTWDFSSTRLLTQGMTHRQKCFIQTVTFRRLCLILLTNIFCFYFLRLMLNDGDGPRIIWILNSKLKAVKTYVNIITFTLLKVEEKSTVETSCTSVICRSIDTVQHSLPRV
jgi:hypothetical protein